MTEPVEAPAPAPAPEKGMTPSQTAITLVVWGVFVALGFLDVPVLGAIQRRALDPPFRLAWIVSHWSDEASFPSKAEICTHPFCRRTDTREVRVGGAPGRQSATEMDYCPEHEPAFLHFDSRFDGLLRFCWWGACMIATALLLFPALALAGTVLVWPARLTRVLRRRASASALLPWFGDGTTAVAFLLSVVVTVLSWFAFAWW